MTQEKSNNKKSTGNNHNSRKPNNRNKRRRNNNKIKLDPLFKKYYIICDELILARKKYFESFYRADKNRMEKLEKVYLKKTEEYSTFESRLSFEEKEKLDKIFPVLKDDVTYSENRDIDLSIDLRVDSSLIEDPHFLESQKVSDFKDDEEESSGNVDDYEAYKSL